MLCILIILNFLIGFIPMIQDFKVLPDCLIPRKCGRFPENLKYRATRQFFATYVTIVPSFVLLCAASKTCSMRPYVLINKSYKQENVLIFMTFLRKF